MGGLLGAVLAFAAFVGWFGLARDMETAVLDVQMRGCGAPIDIGHPVRVEAGRCSLALARRRTYLPSQVRYGAGSELEIEPGEDLVVELVAPPAPGAWSLPDLDDTVLLLDVVAFSGNDTMADSLELVLDDLASGNFDPDVVDLWVEQAGAVATRPPDDAFDAIGRSWAMWMEVQDLRAERER